MCIGNIAIAVHLHTVIHTYKHSMYAISKTHHRSLATVLSDLSLVISS